MIGVIATLKVKEGSNEAFEAGFRTLAAQVKASEPGALVYQLVRSRSEPNVYKVLELYSDEDALKQHGASDYLKRARTEIFAGALEGRSEIEIYDAVT